MSLQKNHFDQLFKPYKKIALAVSGGADSIAMLYMLYDWSIKAKKTLVILSVNHNLRLEAKEECEYVSNLAKSLGLESVILEWKHDGIFSNVHKKAREARYELMTNWCKENGLDALCTAHHMDDRCENFFIRISQGAGILGLIDKEKITYNDVAIIRPIFNSKKADLVKYLEDKKIKFYYDISNQDKKYLRTNIREWLENIPKEIDRELFKNRIISVKNNLERASKVIERVFQEELADKTQVFDEGFGIIKALPRDLEISYMLLSHMLVTIGDKEELPRLEAIEALYEKLSDRHCEEGKMQARHCEKHSDEAIHFYDYGSRRFARDDESGARDEGAPSSPTTKLLEPTHSIHTLNGCVIEKNAKNSYILIYRELGRNSYAPIKLENKAIWDERFLVKTTKHYTDLYVSYLNQDMYSQIKGKINLCGIIKENKKLLFILPIITNLEKVIAIPHINYYDDSEGDSYREIKLEFLRK